MWSHVKTVNGAENVTRAYDDFEVVTGNDSVSILDPFDSGSWRAGDLALKDDVHGLVGINVGWPLDKLGRNCGVETEDGSQGNLKKPQQLTLKFGVTSEQLKQSQKQKRLKATADVNVRFFMKFNKQFVKTKQAHHTRHRDRCQGANEAK